MESGPEIRPATEADLGWMLNLNIRFQDLLSPLDQAGLSALTDVALLTWVAEPSAGFMVAFDQDGQYDSQNFRWFQERYQRFVYVDRIAANPDTGQRGIGRAFYQALFRRAAEDGYPVICAEVNSDPPNDASIAFHQKLGFDTVGEARLSDRGKSVAYFARRLDQ
ncbi:MAG: GNAT family N-acetyltransferase [Pseudomonadota bacterium]